jgi:hypothetical protein
MANDERAAPTQDQIRLCTKLLKTTRSPQKLLDGGKMCAADARYLESPNVLGALIVLLNPKQVRTLYCALHVASTIETW